MIKKFAALLAAFVLLFVSVPAFVEGAIPTPAPPETPVPARIHEIPNPTPAPPVVIDRTADPLVNPSFHFRLDADLLDIWFPNIMNADEAILLYQGHAWLIDCGDQRSGARGVELLQKLGVTGVEKLFNTHPHHDHLNGLYVTHQSVPVEELLVCFDALSTEHMTHALSYAETESISVKEFSDRDVFSMGDGRVTLTFYVNTDPSLDMNNSSAQTLVQFGDRRILFTSDMEKPGQANLLSRIPAENLRAEIMKYPHHGKSGLTDEFLAAVEPSLCIITNTAVDWEGMKYLAYKRVPYVVTNPGNTYLHLVTDGENWIAEYIPVKDLK